MAFGFGMTTYALTTAEFKGPALAKAGPELIDACRGSLLITAAWWVIYYNYIGCQVMALFGRTVSNASNLPCPPLPHRIFGARRFSALPSLALSCYGPTAASP